MPMEFQVAGQCIQRLKTHTYGCHSGDAQLRAAQNRALNERPLCFIFKQTKKINKGQAINALFPLRRGNTNNGV